jgi:hypothetical protein
VLFVPERRRSRGLPSPIRARDVRAADLQEKPTKQDENRADSTRELRRIRRRWRLPGEHRSERQRAIRQSERSNQTQNQVMGFRSRPLIQTIR